MALLASDVALENQTEVRAVGVGQGDEKRVDGGWPLTLSHQPGPTDPSPAPRPSCRNSWTTKATSPVPCLWPLGAPASAG